MNPDEFSAHLRELRLQRDHCNERMRSYPAGSLMRCYYEGKTHAYTDAIKELETSPSLFEFKTKGSNGKA